MEGGKCAVIPPILGKFDLGLQLINRLRELGLL